MQLPEPLPATTVTGQPTSTPLTDSVIEAAVRDAIHQTRYRDDTEPPKVGSAPPVPQPGRPPMSQGATDASVLMLSGSVLTATVGGATTAILWASGHADPVVVAFVFGAPAAALLALGRLMKRAKGVLPDEHHHHYSGPVHQDQRNVKSKTIGLSAKTTNNP